MANMKFIIHSYDVILTPVGVLLSVCVLWSLKPCPHLRLDADFGVVGDYSRKCGQGFKG